MTKSETILTASPTKAVDSAVVTPATEKDAHDELETADLDAIAGGGVGFNHNQNAGEPQDTHEPSDPSVEGEAELDASEIDAVAGGGLGFNHNQNAREPR
jgi:hypothetical protein